MIISLSPLLFEYKFFRITSFGFFAALSIIVSYILLLRDNKLRIFFTSDEILQTITELSICAIIGARALFVAQNWSAFATEAWYEIFLVRSGGLSLLGGLSACSIYMIYLWIKYKEKHLKIADAFAEKAPVTQAIARLGCLFAGCCHGFIERTPHLFSVVYKNPELCKIVGFPLFPSQLLSLVLSLCIFLFFKIRPKFKTFFDGEILAWYFILEGFARIAADFTRFERSKEVFKFMEISFSNHQLISLYLIAFGLAIYFKFKPKNMLQVTQEKI